MKAPIPWDSPEVRASLLRQLSRTWGSWFDAVRWAPQVAEAPAVEAILDGLRRALERGDELALRALEDAARRSGGTTAKQERIGQLERLAKMMDLYLTRASRLCECRGCKTIRGESIVGTLDMTCAERAGWKPMGRLTAEEMAAGFVSFLSEAGPFTHELKRAGALPRGVLAVVRDEKAIAAVAKAFDERLSSPQPTEGEDLVKAGMRALGWTKAKSLYDFRDQRAKRR